MMSTATQWMKDHVWQEIEAMILNDAHFRLVLWVPEQLRNSLDKAWHDNRRRVKRGCNSVIPAQGIFDQLRRMLQKPADVSTASEKFPLPNAYETK